MSLLTTPTAPTDADRIRDAIRALSRRTFGAMLDAQRQGIDLLWHGQSQGLHALTAQQVCDGLGTEAVKVFDFHAALTEFVLTQAAADGVTVEVKWPTYAFTRNQDGTVAIDTETPYTP